MKADACANLLGCRWLGWREDDAPAPTRCPRCGGAFLRVNPGTGVWDPPAPRGTAVVDGGVAVADARDEVDVGQQVVDAFQEIYGGLERLSELQEDDR